MMHELINYLNTDKLIQGMCAAMTGSMTCRFEEATGDCAT